MAGGEAIREDAAEIRALPAYAPYQTCGLRLGPQRRRKGFNLRPLKRATVNPLSAKLVRFPSLNDKVPMILVAF